MVCPGQPHAPVENRDEGLAVDGVQNHLDGLLGRAVLVGVAQKVRNEEVKVDPVGLDDEVAADLALEYDLSILAFLEGAA